MSVTISGITGFINILRRRSGDPTGSTFSDASLAEYIGDGIDFVEQFNSLGYTTSISGTSRMVSSEPDTNAKVIYIAAAEYLIKDEKASQLIANAVVAQDGPQRIDTSKAIGVATISAENAYKKLYSMLEEYKYTGQLSGVQNINSYEEWDLYEFTETGVKL